MITNPETAPASAYYSGRVKQVIDKYYGEGPSVLKDILLIHSQSVTRLALQIVSLHPELSFDVPFVVEAAMLHDIGIVRCDAPAIQCFGTEPYLLHGRVGAEMMRAEGLPRHARVCERHTGAGLTRQAILEEHLPLPAEDFLPETPEEQLICFADKFFSKTHLDRQKTMAQAEHSLMRFGSEGVARFREWERLFAFPESAGEMPNAVLG